MMKIKFTATDIYWLVGAFCLVVLAGVLVNELTLPGATTQPPLSDELRKFDQDFLAGKVIEVKDEVEQYLEEHPRVAEAHFLHGKILAAIGDFALAVDALRNAIALDPKQESYYLLLTQVYARIGWTEEALATLTKLLNNNVSSISGLLLRAELYVRTQRIDLAFDDVKFALRLEPDNLDAVFTRAQLYKLNNEIDLARQDFQRVINEANAVLAEDARKILAQLQP